MSDEQQAWTEERIIAQAEALAAHFKKHDLDHYEMSRMIIRDMRQLKDALRARVAELEQEIARLRAETWQPVEDGDYDEYYIDEQGAAIGIAYEEDNPWGAGRHTFHAFCKLPPNIRLCKRGE